MFEQLCDIIRQAGEMICNARDFDVETKEGRANFATTVDTAVETFLKDQLAMLRPDASFIGEEQENAPMGDEPTWVIDPIDGTTNFIRGFRCSSISVALVENRRPVLGVVYQPYTKELFHAERGKGAYLNGRPIHVASTPFAQAVVGVGTALYDPEMAQRAMQAALECIRRAADIRRSGSAALDFAYVAAGREDAYYEMFLNPWDYAAGALLVEEAGGMFAMPHLDEPDYSRSGGVLACCATCFEEMKELLRPYW